MSRFQDVVINDKGKSYRSCLDQASQMLIFRENALIWEEISSIYLGSDFLPNFDKYSIGNGAGLIASYKNLISSSLLRQKINIFDFSLSFTRTITTNHRCRSGFPHVLPNDNILFLTDDGFLFVYFAERLIFQFDLSSLLKSPPCIVMAASFYRYSGIILLATGELIAFYFDDQPSISKTFKFLKDPTIFSTISDIERPRSMCFIPFDKSPINGTFAIIIDQDGSIITAGKNSFYKVKHNSDVTTAALSSSFTKLALYHSEGNLTITTPTLSRIIEEYPVDTDVFVECFGLAWVGDVIPIGLFDGGVVLLSDDQGAAWYVEGQPFAITEPDSAVILTSNKIYRLSSISKNPSNNSQTKSSDVSANSININISIDSDDDSDSTDANSNESTSLNDNIDLLGALGLLDSPAKVLCQVFDQRYTEPPIDKLSQINIERAIKGCCLAALFVKALDSREFYLNAAVYGLRAIPTLMKPRQFTQKLIPKLATFVSTTINLVRLLEILNQISMPITSYQLNYLSLDDIISRLSQRACFDLAFSITDKLYLFQFLIKGNESKTELTFEDVERLRNETQRSIAFALAENVISSTSDDQQCMSKLAEYQRIEYDKACHIAQLANRPALSKMLAERETRCSRKALCFSEIHQWQDALKYSILSCDSSILLAVISSYISSDDPSFYETIVSYTPALAFSLRFPHLMVPERKHRTLKCVQIGSSSVDPSMRNFVKERGNAPAMSVLAPFEQLEALQRKAVEKGADSSIIGMPLNKTIRILLVNGYEEDAIAIQKACDVKKAKMDALRIQAFAKNGLWNQMTQFVVQKKKRAMWPFVIDLHLQGNKKHLNILLDEISAVDPKAKTSLEADIESQKFDPSNLKDRPSLLDLFS